MPKNRTDRAPTMEDVAELVGVSQTTVSYVLNDAPHANIPEETRERIWNAVKELGYRRNALAHSLRTNRSQLLGLITDEIATTPFAGNVIKGAQEAAWAHGKVLLAVNTDNRPELAAAAIDRLLQHRVDGIIYATAYHRVVSPPATIAQVPAVLVNCYSEDRTLPSVVPNEIQGGMTATRAVLEAGHRRIGFINDIDPIPASFGRLEGYKQALQEYGVAFDESLVVYRPPEAQGGHDAARELLGRKQGVTALFCFNDRMAMGAYEAIGDLGLRVPRALSVVGFDNQELISAHLRPPLSTVALPHYEIGRWAVEHLERLIERVDGREVVRHMIDCPLVERESIAPPVA